jgi:hypothetical protein
VGFGGAQVLAGTTWVSLAESGPVLAHFPCMAMQHPLFVTSPNGNPHSESKIMKIRFLNLISSTPRLANVVFCAAIAHKDIQSKTPATKKAYAMYLPSFKFITRCSLLAFALSPCLLHAAVSGTVSYKGDSWKVVDAVAAKAFMGYELSFSRQAWDRIAWAEDGKFDSFDISKFSDGKETSFFQIKLNSDKAYRSHELSKGAFSSGEGAGKGGGAGLSIDSITETSVVGRFKFSDADYKVDLRFDLPILGRDAPLVLPGVALPANGGEPGKALLETLAAMASGNLEKILAVSAPDKRAQFAEAAKNPDFAKQLTMMKAMQPTDVQVLGGKTFEDRAWVEFKAKREGKPIAGTASMQRIDGKWLMKKLSTRE